MNSFVLTFHFAQVDSDAQRWRKGYRRQRRLWYILTEDRSFWMLVESVPDLMNVGGFVQLKRLTRIHLEPRLVPFAKHRITTSPRPASSYPSTMQVLYIIHLTVIPLVIVIESPLFVVSKNIIERNGRIVSLKIYRNVYENETLIRYFDFLVLSLHFSFLLSFISSHLLSLIACSSICSLI